MKTHRYNKQQPYNQLDYTQLHVKTKQNLTVLSSKYNITFNYPAKYWNVKEYYSKGEYAGEFKDILIEGKGKDNIQIEYWRHETKSRGAGQTLLYVGGRKFVVRFLLEINPVKEGFDLYDMFEKRRGGKNGNIQNSKVL